MRIKILRMTLNRIFKILDKGTMPMIKALVLKDKIWTLTLKNDLMKWLSIWMVPILDHLVFVFIFDLDIELSSCLACVYLA